MSDLKSIIQPYIDASLKAFQDLDADKTSEFYADDAVLIEAGNGCTYGKKKITKFNQQMIEKSGKTTTEVSVKVIGV
ncbi:hypothetical protein WR25_14212 isoform B [Diploscapter pachys]|uniref:SnoaL-like domain-containing protein n=1 Tax=Diploscapter pachys TaxID=2018661 RepID=A0A2A2LN31_9BILA|nr:hypothetical protein WR25_14212 isoform B [Diploscapter pachys]